MPTVLLDGEPFSVADVPANWADLLAQVDRHIESRGHIVTGVRFDGLDEPAFREPQALDQPLEAVATVEVTSGTPSSLLVSCVDEAIASIDALCAAATATGEHYRMFELTRATQELVELSDGISTLIAIGGAVAIAVRGESGGGAPEAALNAAAGELTGYIDTLLSAQEAQDWITVADVLQYDIEPSIRKWEQILGQFSARASAQ